MKYYILSLLVSSIAFGSGFRGIEYASCTPENSPNAVAFTVYENSQVVPSVYYVATPVGILYEPLIKTTQCQVSLELYLDAPNTDRDAVLTIFTDTDINGVVKASYLNGKTITPMSCVLNEPKR